MNDDLQTTENTQEAAAEALEIDPLKMQAFKNELEGQQNLPMALVAGLASAVVGAAIWAGVTVLTKYQIGWMAIAVGVLVGLAVGKAGKGISPVFGWLGGFFAFLGCAIGNLLSVCGFIAIQESLPFLEMAANLLSKPSVAFEVMKATFNPMDILFYALAIYEGYNFSFRQITEQELASLVVDRP